MKEIVEKLLNKSGINHDTHVVVDYNATNSKLEILVDNVIKEVYELIDETELTILESGARVRIAKNIETKFGVSYE